MEKERKRISLATYVVSLIVMLAIIVGLVFIIVRDESKQEIVSNTVDNVVIEQETTNVSELLEKYYDIATSEVWTEFKHTEFDSAEGRAQITNYNEVLNNRFTENGKNVFEEENTKALLILEDEKAYIMAGSENTGEYVKDIKFENIKQEENTITATVVRTMTKEAIAFIEEDELDNAETYSLKDEFVLKLVDGKWLIDNYSWILNYEYKQITKRLDGIDGLCVTEVLENEDNTYTLRGEINTRYTISESELKEILEKGKMRINSEEYIISKGNNEDVLYRLRISDGIGDEHDFHYWIEKFGEGEYCLKKGFEVQDMWKPTNTYAEITVSGDCKVEGQFWGESTVKELFVDKNLGELEMDPLGFLYNFNFKDGKVIEIEHILTSL